MNAPQVERIAQAIGDPGSIVGRKLGPSWGEGNPGYAPDEETVTRWSTRAVVAVLTEDTEDAEAYRALRDAVIATMPDPNNWDDDAAELGILTGYVEHLAEGHGPCARCGTGCVECDTAATHDPCCSSHQVKMCCGCYRRTHFVEVGACCPAYRLPLDPYYAVRRADGELMHGEYSWMAAAGPEDWDAAEYDAEHATSPVEYELVNMRPHLVARRTLAEIPTDEDDEAEASDG